MTVGNSDRGVQMSGNSVGTHYPTPHHLTTVSYLETPILGTDSGAMQLAGAEQTLCCHVFSLSLSLLCLLLRTISIFYYYYLFILFY